MNAIKTLLAVSVLAVAGAAHAATVGTFDVSVAGPVSGPAIGLTGSNSGSGTATLNDDGTLLVTDSVTSNTNLGGIQTITGNISFTGTYAGGVFTATAGTNTNTGCSGANCASVTLNVASPFVTTGGTVAASAIGGIVNTTATQLNGLVTSTENFTFSNFAAAAPAVPVPAAAWLFGSGLLGLAGTARRRRS